MPRWTFMIVTFGALACSGGVGGMQGMPGMGKDRGPDPVTVVEVEPAAVGGVADLLVTSATVESELQADIVPQASGVVQEVRVAEGDAVQSGQVLAILENVSLAEAATRARVELTRLEQDLEATRRLYAEGAVSRSDLDNLERQVKSARSSVREASSGSGKTRLLAPFDGVVAARDVRVGQLASSSQRAFQVVDLDALRVVAALPERDVGRVRIGQPARLVSAYDENLWADGSVERVAPVIDAQTGTFRVILTLAEQHALRPGQYVSVQLEVDRHQDVVVVPKKAVVYEDGAPVVYRMIDAPEPKEGEDAGKKKDEAPKGFSCDFSFGRGAGAKDTDAEEEEPSPFVAQRVAVDVGLVDDTYAEIVEGIRVGDRVVVIGQSNLKDGAPIKTAEMVRQEEAERAERDAGKKDEEAG